MKQRTAKRIATIVYFVGGFALAGSFYLIDTDKVSIGACLAIVGIVLEGGALGLFILYV